MRRALIAATLLLPLASGCGGGGSNAASSGPNPALKMTPAKRYAGALPVVRRYLTALATDRALDAQRLSDPDATSKEQESLTNLRSWFERIPVGAIHIAAKPHKTFIPGAAAVEVTMSARLTPKPLSQWVQLGRRVIIAGWADGGWKVAGDLTGKRHYEVKQVGLSLFPQPSVISGKRVTVVSEAVEAGEDARQILTDADSFMPSLSREYGRGPAAEHPVVFLVRNEKQGERLSGVKQFRKEVPEGFVINATAYIEWPQWGADEPLRRDSVIAHELTHVASWTFLGQSPHSLVEGLAMYHENRFIQHYGYDYPLRNIAAAYRSGFPSIVVWKRRETDWGLRNMAAVDLCYEDGQAMTTVIMTKHGGPAAIGRLARAFTAYHPGRHDFTDAQVRGAFEKALGVSFDQVVAEAHAYADAH